MFYYFGYGSNLSGPSLRAKGVVPASAEPAVLSGWRLTFDIPNFFAIEGGTGNVSVSPDDSVHGVLYGCQDHELARLDELEALGVAYRRTKMTVRTYSGRDAEAYVYVGLPEVTSKGLSPSRRYLNILIRGAEDMQLSPEYIDRLRRTETCLKPRYGPFRFPDEPDELFTPELLATHLEYTAIAGAVFDMTQARDEHRYLKQLLGARDATLFFLKRMDSSDGSESWSHVESGDLSPLQRDYLNDYLHQFAQEYRYAGRMHYAAALRAPSMPSMRPQRISRLDEIASRRVLRTAEETTHLLGHENLGFLSLEHGLMPASPPSTELPRAFSAWDEVAGGLPELYRTLRLRETVHDLPVLDASRDSLPDRDLLRAAAVLGMLSHAYWYVETSPPEVFPEALAGPWAKVRARLGREQAVLTYIDLIVSNYRLIDPKRPDPMRADNMLLAIPTVNNQEERVFYLTQTEILAQASPIIGAVVRAEEAVVHDDPKALSDELSVIIGCLQKIVRESLLNINPNPASESFVNPVIWAKTVAPFAVPMQEGLQGPSGTSSPIFSLLDTFFGRRRFETFLGREIRQLRQGYPLFWREFLGALGEISIPEYVARVGDPSLAGLLKEAVEIYAGDNGFLGRHRMKVYGYLEQAFKVGRSITIGGFAGVFRDRTWDRVDNELEYSRIERLESFPKGCHHATVKSVGQTHGGAGDGVKHVVLDVSGTGVRFEPGDRCGILPENGAEIVDRTLAALGATGDERISLTPEWLAAVRLRSGFETSTELSLRDVLRFGRIRPVVPRVAEALHAATQSKTLLDAIVNQSVTRWEMWDLLLELSREGYDPARLWRRKPESAEYVCHVIPPETFRMYSIASPMELGPDGAATEIELTVGRLRYDAEPHVSQLTDERRGTASNFLADAAGRGAPVSFVIEHPPRFGLPKDTAVPIVMVAGGTGISPFRAFILERLRNPASGVCHLFLALRSRQDLYYREELLHALGQGRLELDVAFSRDEIGLAYESDERGGRFSHPPAPSRRIRDLLLDEANAAKLKRLLRSKSDGGEGAYVYICGRSRFARSVNDAFRELLIQLSDHAPGERAAAADAVLCRMVAEGRYMQEIFTDSKAWDEARPQIPVSEIVSKNDAEAGYWLVIDNLVYDVSDFIRLHPGGVHVLQGYAGMDATQGYLRAHRHRTEIDAMREMHEIGAVRPIDFASVTRLVPVAGATQAVAVGTFYRLWTQLTYLVVEMQNALKNDQSLQGAVTTEGDSPSPRSPYKLQRAIETHERFLRSHLDGIIGEPLSALWNIAHAMCPSTLDVRFLERRLSDFRKARNTSYVEDFARSLKQRHERLTRDGASPDSAAYQSLVGALSFLERANADFLARTKALLRDGLLLFETHESRVLDHAAPALLKMILGIPELVESYTTEVYSYRMANGWAPSILPPRATSVEERQMMNTLVSSDLWLMEEDKKRKVVVLKRSAQPVHDTRELILKNQEVMARMGPEHAAYGIVVDMRQAPSRNDPEFENAMRLLRSEVAKRYARVAVLVTSAVGVLQVARMSRNEGAETFATQSEQAALRFAMGG
jgi:sulfite reductase alpha subunit-like flavoprotein/cytochrome b involved in lipid metabolism/gamma-glutamylcyclotransferase (GGCT)/AIG2-like uncharacterized protein YtfP